MTTQARGRNELCHCGSGRKYKHCCLDKDAAKARAAHETAAAEAPSPPGDAAGPRPPKHQTYQPWKRTATNTHGFHHRVSSPRKVGSG